jgi:hypothetical protein
MLGKLTVATALVLSSVGFATAQSGSSTTQGASTQCWDTATNMVRDKGTTGSGSSAGLGSSSGSSGSSTLGSGSSGSTGSAATGSGTTSGSTGMGSGATSGSTASRPAGMPNC